MKKLITLIAAVSIIFSLAVPIFGASKITTNDAQLRPDFSIVIDGDEVDFKSATGEAVYPILYQDSTYLPLRAIGEMMGKNVNWDEKNKIITISGKRDSASSSSSNPNIGKRDIRVQERPDFTIIIENEEKEFYSAARKRIYPILYDGSTYLPLRAIGEIMNKEVIWDGVNKVVTLNGDFTVTDADSFETTDKEEIKEGYIGRKEAQRLALKHALENENTVTFFKTELNKRNGQWIYDIEFYSDEREYDYEIDAKKGTVLDYDYDIDGWNRPATEISLEKAKEIALSDAGFKEKQVTFVKAKLDYDDGKKIYEIEFYKGNQEYDYEIDAATGKILAIDYDAEDYTPKKEESKNAVTLEEAKEIALKHAAQKYDNIKTKDATFTKAKLDSDDGRKIYEVEFRIGRMEFEYDIDAETGKILDFDSDYDD